MKPILITSGEPAGVGPDLCLELAKSTIPVIILGDIKLFEERAKLLNIDIKFNLIKTNDLASFKNHYLNILHIPLKDAAIPGILNPNNSCYVLQQLNTAAELILNDNFHAVVTAPIHKGIINQAGYAFTGHTEFFQAAANVKNVVMMLACPQMRLTTVTTHVPLNAVSKAISKNLIISHVQIVATALTKYFNCPQPQIIMCGLNPHAGENGHIGTEELEIIIPALSNLQAQGINITGPCSADTMFSTQNMKKYDAFVTMFHDQGLPVIKYLGFGSTVNITLGLPFIRTSVDHGTALNLAASGKANAASLLAAVKQAYAMLLGESHL